MTLHEANQIVFNKVKQWTVKKEDILALGIVGSRSDKNSISDEYSDYDLLLVTNNVDKYLNNESWISEVNEYWYSFTEYIPSENHTERRVLFKNGIDVDFIFIDYEKIKNDPGQFCIAKDICRRPIEIVMDKVNIEIKLRELESTPPKYEAPNEKQFNELIAEFYYHYIWIYKKLCRGEYWIAYRCLNYFMKSKMIQVFEWYEHCKNGNEYNTYYDSRYLEKWVEPEIKKKLGILISSYEKESMVISLNESAKLIDLMSKYIAEKLGYKYSSENMNEMLEWAEQNLREKV